MDLGEDECVNEELDMAENMIINEGLYCRLHLRIQCHICQVTYQQLHDDTNVKRRMAGLRPCGDPFLNYLSDATSSECSALQIYMVQKLEKGKEAPFEQYQLFTPPFQRFFKHAEEDLNSRYQTRPTCRVCTNCGIQSSPKLQLRLCMRCKTVCYCSVECQRQSWKKEHKVECAPQLRADFDCYIKRVEDRIALNPKVEEDLTEILSLSKSVKRIQEAHRPLREKIQKYVNKQGIMDFIIPSWVKQYSYEQVEEEYAKLHPP